MKLTNTIQKKLKVSSTQLLYQSAPYQAAILFATGPFVDQLLTNRSVFAHKYSTPVVVCSLYIVQWQISATLLVTVKPLEENNAVEIFTIVHHSIAICMPVAPLVDPFSKCCLQIIHISQS